MPRKLLEAMLEDRIPKKLVIVVLCMPLPAVVEVRTKEQPSSMAIYSNGLQKRNTKKRARFGAQRVFQTLLFTLLFDKNSRKGFWSISQYVIC